ncbi:hypothetical protein K435DRAFT_857138 [Dendrothele bispora CBS 962.96]|uniref:Uncharacterized protein n=1 Tax=Dendrothele bispora (strain CBS 962.96) TaxID=1314807 RepID=A0A4S8M776_DENBC|nr:hypothetical protein K435DRAFT_857138 [Dendrothele bispora CBS 962.96]
MLRWGCSDFQNTPLAVIGGANSAAEEATLTPSLIPPLPCPPLLSFLRQRNKLLQHRPHEIRLPPPHHRLSQRALPLENNSKTTHPKITILWNTVATECQGDSELLKNLQIKSAQTVEEEDLAVNGLFYALDGHIATVPGTTRTSVKDVFAAGEIPYKRYRQAIKALQRLGVDVWLLE